MVEDEAVEMFWNTPELAEKVLPCLSARDILNLVRVGLLNIKILQKLVVWNKLIKRNFPPAAQPNFGVLMTRVDSLVDILKIMENHQPCLLATLDLICQRFPSSDSRNMVTLSCPNNDTKLLSPDGFTLLEQVEGALGSTEHKIERIRIQIIHIANELGRRWLPALSARVARQQQLVQLVEIDDIIVDDEETLDQFGKVVENCATMRVRWVGVFAPLKDWSKLRRSLCSPQVSLFCFGPARNAILGQLGWEDLEAPAKREDLRAIWDVTLLSWGVYTWIDDDRRGTTYFDKNQGDEDWGRFEHLMDMSKEEIDAWGEQCCDKWLVHERLGYHEAEDEDEEDEEFEEDGVEEED